MRIRMLAMSMTMAWGTSAWAETPRPPAQPSASPAPSAPWDESHMRSRYQETPRGKRPLITGESGYGALASGSSQTATRVSPELEFTSQREWAQGPLSTSSSANAASGSESSPQPSRISRGSAIRAASVTGGH